jgi:hypothetical protein
MRRIDTTRVLYDEQDKLVKVRTRSAVWSICDQEAQT